MKRKNCVFAGSLIDLIFKIFLLLNLSMLFVNLIDLFKSVKDIEIEYLKPISNSEFVIFFFVIAISVSACVAAIVYNFLIITKSEDAKKQNKYINFNFIFGALSFLYILIYICIFVNEKIKPFLDLLLNSSDIASWVLSYIAIYIVAWLISSIFYIIAKRQREPDYEQNKTTEQSTQIEQNKTIQQSTQIEKEKTEQSTQIEKEKTEQSTQIKEEIE